MSEGNQADAISAKSDLVDLQLIWDHSGKRIIDTVTGEDLTARYGIETIVGLGDGSVALKLAAGLGVEAIDVRYSDERTSDAARPIQTVVKCPIER